MPIPGLSRNKVFGQCLCNGLEHGLPLISRSFAQLLHHELDVTEDFIGRSRHVGSALSAIRIAPDASDPRIRPGRYRVAGIFVAGAALAADQMLRYLQHRHALGKTQDLGFQIEMALRPPVATVGRSASNFVGPRHWLNRALIYTERI